MPQLDLIWWGFNFFISWSFLFISFVYFTNMKFVSVYSSGFSDFSSDFSGCLDFEWLW
uniref:ATP synthase F0 subunit 8 n=1 Tax=Metacrinus rotundus TaxID=228699 RepID=UPI00226C9B72|nr:ATP synthase F0 subunit 8 [Metacrinus rotundus]UZH93088.1 ATP synthase F0 subunit 8 [Metacrinus rotundus]